MYFLRTIALSAFLFTSAVPVFARPETVEISETEIIRGRQDFGETRLNKSVDGNALRIAGTTYANGIGAHATSMIPIDVPANARRLRGKVGLDDETSGGDGAEFRVLSGSEVLWSSGVMKSGEPAKAFSVSVPQGAKKLYLLALAGKTNNGDHADWVDLKWEDGQRTKTNSSGAISGKKFGLKPNVEKDQTNAFREIFDCARTFGHNEIVLEPGTYHFYAENALDMSLWISNHDQQPTQQVMLPLVDLRNLKIRGNGSTFIFHGKCLPVLFMDCENVTLEGIRIDFARPLYSEAKVLGFKNGKTIVSIDKKAFPYEIRDGRLFFVGENYPLQPIQSVIAFREGTKNIVSNTADIGCGSDVTVLPGGKIALHRDFSKDGDGVAVGDTLTLRTWWRPAPACVIYRAKNTVLRDVSIHSSFGMTLLAQRSENIKIEGTKTAEDQTSGMFPRPETGRVYSASADATHFSNVKGKVIVKNSFFETMMDDAINVHSTCLDIAEILAPDTIRCRYRHGQAIGFELFESGENLRFIAGKTLENSTETVPVKSVRRISPTEVLITLKEAVPANVKPGDAVENADYQPEVVFCGNIVRNNRARGALFTTPRKVVVEGNVFKNVAGSAILLAGDAQGWYESGACEDVVIRNNLFINNLTSRFQFTNAVISIYPEVRDLASQKRFYHRNIDISNNVFHTFDVPLLFAISTEKIKFTDNRIFYNADFKGWKQPPFHFRRCSDILIRGNKVEGVDSSGLKPQSWSLKDCRLELTAPDEVKF
ncbi:MAG: NPCBM/NEW2 domain-containing protein [Opitutales bacterium]|nr:NPCBM/NEW2 domain-containing protein [Opitutales bacterium]